MLGGERTELNDIMWKQAEKSGGRILCKTVGSVSFVSQCYEREGGGGKYGDSFQTLKGANNEMEHRFRIRFLCGQTRVSGGWRTMGKLEIVLDVRQNVIEM